MFHGMFFFAICVALYFLPAIIGSKKHNATAILLVNLLLGWTVIGWFVALIMALSSTPAPGGFQAPGNVPAYQPPIPQPSPQPAPPPSQVRTSYCSKCGTALGAGDKFCPSCGSSVPV